jgi:hypothetical protein
MIKYLILELLILVVFTTFLSCKAKAPIATTFDKTRILSGELTETDFSQLKQYIQTFSNTLVKDTIIIKYDFNNETCWNLLDGNTNNYIMRVLKSRQEKIKTMQIFRPNVSIFNFREPGNNLNKLKKLDNTILIDSTKQIKNLLFEKQYTCGSSIIIMPNKKFVFIKSDSHNDILDLNQKQIEELLSK